METINTAPVKANWAVVPQIPSGRAKTRLSPTAIAPAWPADARLPPRSAQQGPTMSKPMRTTRGPRSESAAAMSSMITTLSLQKRRLVRSVTRVSLAAGCPRTAARGSISGPALGRLLTPASGADRSIRAVGPQLEIGARARQIDGYASTGRAVSDPWLNCPISGTSYGDGPRQAGSLPGGVP